MNDESHPVPSREPTDIGRAKEPYETPAILAVAVFETLALACGKETEGDFDCFLGGGASS